ncbi:MAG TPA: hypothetical protein VFP94_06140 [Terriglobales bacterium]|nr:hypothetical protein [Terriglobales bacterium]
MAVRAELERELRARGWGASLERRAPAHAGLSEWAGTAGSSRLTRDALRWAAGGVRVAWVDPCDCLDPASAQRAGVELEQLLWLRGDRGWAELRGLEGLSRWNEILNLLAQSGAVERMVADFLDWPAEEMRRIPRSAWFRLQRGLEQSGKTEMLLLTPAAVAGRCAVARRGVAQAAAALAMRRRA